MSEKSSGTSGGIGFVGLLQIVFITLKLCKVIDWSWWWVLSPMLISASIVAALLGVAAFCFIMALIVKARSDYK